jgi:3-hydroxyisobutyrate dehydrogenase-like beta-hydroxyacid dehydrogenase
MFLKDLNAIQALAAEYGLKFPLAEQLRAAYLELVDTGYAEEDHGGFWRHVMK